MLKRVIGGFLAAAAAVMLHVAPADAVAIPSLGGAVGSNTVAFNAFDTLADTTIFEFELLAPAAGNVRVDVASPGLLGATPVVSFAGAVGPLGGPHSLFGSAGPAGSFIVPASVFAALGDYVLAVTGVGAAGPLSSYQLTLTVTPLPAAAMLLGTALIGLGIAARLRRTA